MQISFDNKSTTLNTADIHILGAFSTSAGFDTKDWNDKKTLDVFKKLKHYKNFKAQAGETLSATQTNGVTTLIVGLGSRKEFNRESLRKTIAKVYKSLNKKLLNKITIDTSTFQGTLSTESTLYIICESLFMSSYRFDKYKSKKESEKLKKVILRNPNLKSNSAFNKAYKSAKNIAQSVNFARDLVNETPNYLHSEKYADVVAKDAKENLTGVKVKILNKAAIKKEKMNLLLSVNAGSFREPRLVHLTYTPKNVGKNTKHLCLVGKGITFDTGGYSLKPGGSMMGMKFDMGGSATVYGAFRAAVLEKSPHKITCILAMTDNKIGPDATVPDSVVTGRSGKTVEILNTDAEGRLILADALDYACDLKPDCIVDSATLTDACLISLGTEVCGLMANDDKIADKLLGCAKDNDEYLWRLPIIKEYREDLKSHIADLKNIGGTRYAGTAKAAAFLEEFIKNDIPYAHLDIAGVCDSQSHLPYCNSKGASGLMVRTLCEFLK